MCCWHSWAMDIPRYRLMSLHISISWYKKPLVLLRETKCHTSIYLHGLVKVFLRFWRFQYSSKCYKFLVCFYITNTTFWINKVNYIWILWTWTTRSTNKRRKTANRHTKAGSYNQGNLMLFNNRPFATNDHMVQSPPCWRASSLLFPHWDIKKRASHAWLVDVSLF